MWLCPLRGQRAVLHTVPVALRGRKMTFLLQYGTSETPGDWLASGAASSSRALSHGRPRVFDQRCSRQPRETCASKRPYHPRGEEPLDFKEISLSLLQSQHCFLGRVWPAGREEGEGRRARGQAYFSPLLPFLPDHTFNVDQARLIFFSFQLSDFF